MTIRKTARRFASGIGALAIAVAGIAATGTAASAAVGPDQPNHPAEGSLNIHKLVGEEGPRGTGAEQNNVPGEPLEGAEFTLWRLGTLDGAVCTPIDLTNTNEWSKVPTGAAPATLDGVEDAGFCATEVGTDTTDEDGNLTFGALAIGLYYVQETDAPSAIVSRVAPFYVSVPTLNENDWIYDVHVYPKNQELGFPRKTINSDSAQTGLALGSTVEWTITQDIPALNAGETYNSASIWDKLPASLEYVATTSVKLDGVALDDADYTIDPDGVTWELTAPGRAKLDGKAGKILEVVFTTKVLSVTSTGEIANPGGLGDVPGYGSEFNRGTIPGTTTPRTYWGQLKVTKVDSSNPAKPLDGAEFKVFPLTGATCSNAVPATGLVADGISGNDGVVTWTPNNPDNSSPLGLFVANSSNGELTNPAKSYCLYETKAPAGYTGVGVQTLNITPGTTLVAGINDITVANTPRETPDLPLTGAQGTLAMTLGGLVLVGLGAGALVMARRRNKSA